jgi:hypothetical protein
MRDRTPAFVAGVIGNCLERLGAARIFEPPNCVYVVFGDQPEQIWKVSVEDAAAQVSALRAVNL